MFICVRHEVAMRVLNFGLSVLLIMTITCLLGCAADANAPKVCPEGKTAITRTTPGGQVTEVCVAVKAAPAKCPCFSKGEAEAFLSTSEYSYTHRLWDGMNGTADACESVVIRREQDVLGAVTALSDPGTGCITTDDYPTGSMSKNGCLLHRQKGSLVILTEILAEESAACIEVFKALAL
jgi:hypothetical protein